jgi:hypothetical protein
MHYKRCEATGVSVHHARSVPDAAVDTRTQQPASLHTLKFECVIESSGSQRNPSLTVQKHNTSYWPSVTHVH